MTEVKKALGTWLTGTNVPTLHPEQGLVGTKGETPAQVATPAKSAGKEEWYAYRRSQGFTEDELKGMTKDKLIAMDDAAEDDADDGDNDPT